MTLAEIVTKIRRGIQEPNPVYYQDSDIQDSVYDAIRILALRIQEKDPAYFSKRSVLFSLTHLFEWPTDCKHLLNVWDLGSVARLITDASNATPIIVQNYDHPYSDGDIVTVQGVTGNTAANGTWQVTYVDADHFSLVDSTGNGAFTATDLNYPYDADGNIVTDATGEAISTYYSGMAFGEPDAPDRIYEKLLADSDYSSYNQYYTRGRNVVIDDGNFNNSIIIDYTFTPSLVTDIPTEYQHGLVSWPITQLMVIDGKKDQEKVNQVRRHGAVFQDIIDDIVKYTKSTTEPTLIKDVWTDEFNAKAV